MKKNTLAKFTNIAYPIFTLKHKPYKIHYDLHKIYCTRTPSGHRETVDNKKLAGDYFARLLQLEQRITFDYTCKSLQDVIYSRSKWGIDKNAMPHNFSKTYKVPAEKRRVTKVSGNLLWLRNISYPFEIPTQENIRLDDTLYATIVLVNWEWYIKEFSLDSKLEVPYYYV
jgi:hypothetical protein